MKRLARTLMIQGTASGVGKSVIVAGLCRHYARRGYRVAPFKAQNMALNSYVTPDGGEIGRAQAVQARAALVEPRVDMNPILLKPEADSRCQAVVLGRSWRSLPAREYYAHRSELWPVVRRSLRQLRRDFDLVLIEGAGSPAEINLERWDMVNMAVAEEAGAPVLLVGDIDRGGVFASLFGTLALLRPAARDRVRGLVINRFRGDPGLLEPGLLGFELLVGLPVLGVVPHAGHLLIPEEDAISGEWQEPPPGAGPVDIAVIRLPHVANHDDFDSLRLEPGVRLRWVSRPSQLGHPQAVILPSSKTTIDDLRALKRAGLARAIRRLAREGRAVVGICGGFQMMGRRLSDPLGVESSSAEAPGLGLLPVETVFEPEKATRRARGRVACARGFFGRLRGSPVEGYEIHMGHTAGGEAVFKLAGPDGAEIEDGAVDPGGRVWGTYLHGVFDNTELRRAWLRSLGWRPGPAAVEMEEVREGALEAWAGLLARHLDMRAIDGLLGLAC